MKKVLIFYGILVIAIIIFALSRGFNLINFSLPGTNNSSTPTAKIGNKTYTVVLAKTDKEKEQGLSGKNNLPANTGYLFVFAEKGNYGFWMNGMKFPIDIVFINDNKVVDVVENAPAPSTGQAPATLPIYKPSEPVNYVLEIAANEVSKNNIKKGDTVEFKNIQ
ncbi:MAG: DUF192 domain-containing protein [Candidatus Levybacteria bacterium]|nr:DUF192 domain-containing protein [Candidatus Levybacteria bacterium]